MARSFNGTSDYIGPANVNIGGDITVSSWIYCTNVSAQRKVLGNWDETGPKEQFLISVANPQALFARSDGTGNNYRIATGTSSTVANTWTHVLGLGRGVSTGNGAEIWVNGSQEAVAATLLPGPNAANNFSIGAEYNNGSPLGWFPGRIADVAIWSAILTAGEIAALASGVRPYLIRPASLAGYWPLDGLASPEPDLSGNKNNGALTGTTSGNNPPVTLFTRRMPAFSTPFIPPSPGPGLGPVWGWPNVYVS